MKTGEVVQKAAGGDPAHEAIHCFVRNFLQPGPPGEVSPKAGEGAHTIASLAAPGEVWRGGGWGGRWLRVACSGMMVETGKS